MGVVAKKKDKQIKVEATNVFNTSELRAGRAVLLCKDNFKDCRDAIIIYCGPHDLSVMYPLFNEENTSAITHRELIEVEDVVSRKIYVKMYSNSYSATGTVLTTVNTTPRLKLGDIIKVTKTSPKDMYKGIVSGIGMGGINAIVGATASSRYASMESLLDGTTTIEIIG